MPPYAPILASNALLSTPTPQKRPYVAVLAGSTSGIGLLTLRALLTTGAPARIYLVGRPSSLPKMTPVLTDLGALNPAATIIWTEGEISLLAEVRRICDDIKEKEEVVDLLLLTAGYAPFGTRVDTAEGVEVAGALEYYGRVLFAELLLPCLRKAEAGRVVSVLGGGLERVGAVGDVEDLDMRKGKWSGFRAQAQYAVMNTLGLERLGEERGEGVTFVHAWPALGDCTPNGKVLGKLREMGVQEKVWEHTREVLKPYV